MSNVKPYFLKKRSEYVHLYIFFFFFDFLVFCIYILEQWRHNEMSLRQMQYANNESTD